MQRKETPGGGGARKGGGRGGEDMQAWGALRGGLVPFGRQN